MIKRMIATSLLYLLVIAIIIILVSILSSCQGSRYMPEEYYKDEIIMYAGSGGGVYVIEKDTIYKEIIK